jgi:hypothetical protein
VIEDTCKKYACACTVKMTAKPSQPIEKSTAGAGLLTQMIVTKYADHLPLHRQAKIFRRWGAELSDQTMCGWMRQRAELLESLYGRLKTFVPASKEVGDDDRPVKVLDRKLAHTRKGRIWPYLGDSNHRAEIYDYTPTRERAGREKFLKSKGTAWRSRPGRDLASRPILRHSACIRGRSRPKHPNWVCLDLLRARRLYEKRIVSERRAFRP